MDTSIFNIALSYQGNNFAAQVKPCCGENNIVDYAIYHHNELLYTITHSLENGRWATAVKNADDIVDDDLIQQIGQQIELHNDLSKEI